MLAGMSRSHKLYKTELVAAVPSPWLKQDLTEEQEKHAVHPIEIRSCQSDVHASAGGTLLSVLRAGIVQGYYLSILGRVLV